MAKGIARIELKKQRGKLCVITMGLTPRGQKFLKQQVILKATSTSDPKFKSQLAAAVEELMAQDTLPGL